MQWIKIILGFLLGLNISIFLCYLVLGSIPSAVGSGTLLYIAAIVLLVGNQVKTQVLAAIPQNLQLVSARPEEYPLLDTEKFERFTKAWQELGFEWQADLGVTSQDNKHTPAFGRLLAHRERGCFAEISQVFSPQFPHSPVGNVLLSTFVNASGDQSKPGATARMPAAIAQNSASPIPDPVTRPAESRPLPDDLTWTLATTDRVPDAVLWIVRHPRKVVSRHPNAMPGELLQFHLEKRQEMSEVLRLAIDNDLTLETYKARTAQVPKRMKRALARKSGWHILYEWRFVGPKKMEWWGEYSDVAPQAPGTRPTSRA